MSVEVRSTTVRAGQRVLGLDPGTRVVGYGVVELVAGGFRYVECGIFRASESLRVPDRIHLLAADLRGLLAEIDVDHVAIEAAFHGRNAASTLKLAEARGALREVCMTFGLLAREYPPALVKRTVAGRGRASKEEIKRRVQLLCGLERAPVADAADALSVAIHCCLELRGLATLHRPPARPRANGGGAR